MTGATTGDFSQLLLGLCAGCLLAMAAAMLRAPRPTARWAGFAFFFSSAFFAIKLWCDETHALPPEVRIAIGVIAMTSVGWFWLMVMALFGDCDEYRPSVYAAPAALALFALGHQLPAGPWMYVVWTGSILLQAALAIVSLVVVVRSWKGDLVESRRQVRGPFMVAVSLYILSLNGFDIWEMIGEVPAWYPMFNAALLAIVVLGGAFTFLDPRSEMFGDNEQPALPRQPELAVHATSANGHASGAANGKVHANGNGAAVVLDRGPVGDLSVVPRCLSCGFVHDDDGVMGRGQLQLPV